MTDSLRYQKLFDPQSLRPAAPPLDRVRAPYAADYEYDDRIVLAVNVALATGRPLLLRGDPGSGKSTLAADVARLLRRRYYEQVVSSNVEAADLLFRFDQVSRIADAQARLTEARTSLARYLEPGILFWAFDPSTAARYPEAHGPGKLASTDDTNSLQGPERRTWPITNAARVPAVVLIDEIDKAEPDFPNDLLIPLGSLSFAVRSGSLDFTVEARPEMRPLVMLTTNEERDLPPAFLRRCVVLRLIVPERADPGPQRLETIVRRHFEPALLDDETLMALMDRYFDLRESAQRLKLRPPGTAELIDAARALIELREAGAESARGPLLRESWGFRELTEAALWKHRQPAPEGSRR